MKTIVFGITSLDFGGAERVLIDLANQLQTNYNITIFTIYSKGDLEKELNKNIKVISVYPYKYAELSKIEKTIKSLLFSSKIFIKNIYQKYINNKYDYEIAFLEGPITSIFSNSRKQNKIAWVHTNLSKHLINSYKKKQYQTDYNKYKNIIFVSKEALSGFNDIFKTRSKKIIINNYINVNLIKKKAIMFKVSEIKNVKNIPTFLSVCRLVKAKGILRLVLVSKKLIENGYYHKIYIIGDGPEHDKIKKEINNLKINDSFILLGKKDNPYPYMKKADYFILPSLYEGYPIVVVEAMILEKNIITTNTGAIEALSNYNNKLITDNSFEGLYKGLKQILIGQIEFKKGVINRYNSSLIINKIIKVLEE